MQKGKVLSEGALQIADKRREMKGKKERERYTHVNAVLQRLARRNKKAFFSEESKKQLKTIGKTKDLFKKTGDTRGIFHAKMGTIKGRNGKDLTEAEEIKKR